VNNLQNWSQSVLLKITLLRKVHIAQINVQSPTRIWLFVRCICCVLGNITIFWDNNAWTRNNRNFKCGRLTVPIDRIMIHTIIHGYFCQSSKLTNTLTWML
jgi:hypothetical protein